MKRKYEIVVLSRGGFARTLRVYVPRSADRAVIMHDGQNVFDDETATFKKSWRALDCLKAEKVRNTAIIGIDSSDATRLDDYLPFPTELEKYGIKKSGGKTDVYREFILQTVIPYLDKRFGFKFYGMLGSSAGATATLYCAAMRDSRIKAYGMFSTPLFVSPAAFSDFLKTDFDNTAMYRVYVGGRESADVPEYSTLIPDMYVDSAFTLIKALRASGATDIRFRLENKNVHDEISWRAPEREFFKDFSLIE